MADFSDIFGFTENEYQRRLARGRRIIMRQSLQDLESDIINAWLQELSGVTRAMHSGNLSPEAADRLQREILNAIQRWGGRVDGITKNISERSINNIRRLHERLLGQAEVEINYSFDGFNVDALEGMFVRRDLNIVDSFKTMSNLNVSKTVKGPLQDVLTEAAKGAQSWQDVTSDVARLLSYSTGGDEIDMSAVRMATEGSDLSVMDVMSGRLDELDMSSLSDEMEARVREAVKRMNFNARRIAQTEIDVAAHEGERVAAVRNPIVKALQWKTSGRHDNIRSSPDVCDVFEEYDFYGIGGGTFFAETLPAKPHPFDGCTRLYVIRDVQEWGAAKAEPVKPASVTQQEVVEVLARNRNSKSRELTPNFISYTTAQANKYVQLAWQVYNNQQSQAA